MAFSAKGNVNADDAIANEDLDAPMPFEPADSTTPDLLAAPTSPPATENAEAAVVYTDVYYTDEMENDYYDDEDVADDGKIRAFVSPNNHLSDPNTLTLHRASAAIISIAPPMLEDTTEDIDIEPVVIEAIQPQRVVSDRVMQDAIIPAVVNELEDSVVPTAFVGRNLSKKK